MKVEWVTGFEIKAVAENGGIVISANREGLLSLAKQLTELADGVPGDHIHYDEHNALEQGSAEMIIEKVKSASRRLAPGCAAPQAPSLAHPWHPAGGKDITERNAH